MPHYRTHEALVLHGSILDNTMAQLPAGWEIAVVLCGKAKSPMLRLCDESTVLMEVALPKRIDNDAILEMLRDAKREAKRRGME